MERTTWGKGKRRAGSLDDLRRVLHRIDGKGYKAYKDLEGGYDFGRFSLHVDHVQGDPFAAPSMLRVRVPMNLAGFPEGLFGNSIRRMALEDFIARRFGAALPSGPDRGPGSGKSGLVSIDAGGQEVLERTACRVTPHWVEVRIYVGLPAAGRRILGRQAERIHCEQLPRTAEKGLFWRNYPRRETEGFVGCVENQEFIRDSLQRLGLVAFVADGSILPRERGNSQQPLAGERAVAFRSAEGLRVSLDLTNPVSTERPETRITGMGIPAGVTLVVGGGYHGKSTLLQALQRGVYPHIPGDGREYTVTCTDAVKIRAEDGRRVEKVDISPFITNLPHGLDTTAFSTDNASGSTSQAANIVEALESGARLLLLDEDTSATNFMVRDVRMQSLVHKDFEPITPFIERVREIHRTLGVSTILVMGGCGDYFEVADRVIMMREYVPEDVTDRAREVARLHATGRRQEAAPGPAWRLDRIPIPESFDPSRGRRSVKIDAKEIDLVLYGRHPIDLRGVEQIVDFSQTRAVGAAVHLAASRFMDGRTPLREVLDRVEAYLDEHGLDHLDPFHRGERHPGSFARPRRHEIAAAANRLRPVRFRIGPGS
ncbi:MAG: ATPase [Deltaproteobacteria bacterium]|nr:MAG: ATPase [Deltaproteobacteria bacterium]